jgi:hypothetical protein
MSKAIEQILKGSIAVENCFLAAGVTITMVTALQSVGIVMSWVR